MSKIIVIVGPTASGKTKLSIEVAKFLNAEIINADAVQMYKDIVIGAAKTTEEEMQGIKHHMIDFMPLNKTYTIFDYQKDGREVVNKLINENKNIVIVGGSGLYIKALLYNYNLEPEIKNNLEPEIKNNLEYDNYNNEALKELINDIYPENDIHINNRKRMLRFLEHYNNTNEIIKNKNEKDEPIYDFEIIGLKADRKELYEYINKRVDNMFEKGLLEEAKYLYDSNKNTDKIIGYKELNKYFRNEITLEVAKEEIKKNTRRYAKRQYTFFINQFNNVIWIDIDYNNFDKTIDKVINILK